PAEADAVSLRSIITGHGQGNLHNCAEFCPRNHGFLVVEQPFVREIWRDDCDQTPIEGQQGTWQYPRAGWCPGAEVIPWLEDVSAAAPAGQSVTVSYDVETYENSCRPDAPVCTGCALGTGCEYDGGNHTPPIYDLSAMLIAYRNVGQ
ncbi:MAG TPA: peptide-N-glycosidase F-related protein, partial [Enhygromyxa sp.]|nr:peptide-N-glycosidase F-related protein [Enhygromyxa sp.]